MSWGRDRFTWDKLETELKWS